MGMGMGGNGNRDDGKMGMGLRYWAGNGNRMGMGMIQREWERMGTAIAYSRTRLIYSRIPALQLCSCSKADRPIA